MSATPTTGLPTCSQTPAPTGDGNDAFACVLSREQSIGLAVRFSYLPLPLSLRIDCYKVHRRSRHYLPHILPYPVRSAHRAYLSALCLDHVNQLFFSQRNVLRYRKFYRDTREWSFIREPADVYVVSTVA